ncbi:MAG: FtsH protease activity modulator HflK [Hyphomicrobiales bacterium]|nr:FtsH protease activity modulator HflK [Hyphomicrobiales bacterium]MDE2016965.1 FtsH protease activity modulator HflK [Hyphomicrobiales bacterium]
MSWNNQNGGGGPWRPGGPGQTPGPWGSGPRRPPGGPTPPDLEDLLRRLRDALGSMFGGGGRFGPVGAAAVALVVIGLWLVSGFYQVQPNEVGLNLVFGRYVGKTTAGLNYNWPWPIGGVIKPAVYDQNVTDVGWRSPQEIARFGGEADVPQESLMLTGDLNIADVKFRVNWQVDPAKPEAYAFNVRLPDETVKAVAEAAMREVIGRNEIQKILTVDRKLIEPQVQDLMQRILDSYDSGVLVRQVQLQSVNPPAQVLPAYRDVSSAQQDQDRLRNEAQAYANSVVPDAQGRAARIVQQAEAYRLQTVAEAKGQAARFTQVLAQYEAAPAVTRERLYLETMEKVLGGANKVIVGKGVGGVASVLPLPAYPAAAPPPAPAAGAAQ